MKRAVAHAVFYVLMISSSAGTCLGADLNSPWSEVGQAKLNKKTQPTVRYRPDLSLDENNKRIKEHRAHNTIVSSSVAVNQLNSLQLVNHPARLELDGQHYEGRVTAVTLSADRRTATVFAEISASEAQLGGRLTSNAGLLSVEG